MLFVFCREKISNKLLGSRNCSKNSGHYGGVAISIEEVEINIKEGLENKSGNKRFSEYNNGNESLIIKSGCHSIVKTLNLKVNDIVFETAKSITSITSNNEQNHSNAINDSDITIVHSGKRLTCEIIPILNDDISVYSYTRNKNGVFIYNENSITISDEKAKIAFLLVEPNTKLYTKYNQKFKIDNKQYDAKDSKYMIICENAISIEKGLVDKSHILNLTERVTHITSGRFEIKQNENEFVIKDEENNEYYNCMEEEYSKYKSNPCFINCINAKTKTQTTRNKCKKRCKYELETKCKNEFEDIPNHRYGIGKKEGLIFIGDDKYRKILEDSINHDDPRRYVGLGFRDILEWTIAPNTKLNDEFKNEYVELLENNLNSMNIKHIMIGPFYE
jgi:hypothetical protein